MWTEHTEYEEYLVFRYQHNNTLCKISSNYRYRQNPQKYWDIIFFNIAHPYVWACLFSSMQDYFYSAFHDTIVAKQLYRTLRFYNRFIYCRILIYLTYDKMWFILLIDLTEFKLKTSTDQNKVYDI